MSAYRNVPPSLENCTPAELAEYEREFGMLPAINRHRTARLRYWFWMRLLRLWVHGGICPRWIEADRYIVVMNALAARADTAAPKFSTTQVRERALASMRNRAA